jgi:hypothetical protein
MKATSLVRTLAVLLFGAAASASQAADTATVTLTLSGEVKKACTLTIDGGASGTYTFPEASFQGGFSGTTGTIATLVESCNGSYDVSIRSQNNLNLVSGTNMIPYVLKYGTFTSSGQDFSNFFEVFSSVPKSPAGGTSRAVELNYSVPADANPGVYTDTLFFKVTAE